MSGVAMTNQSSDNAKKKSNRLLALGLLLIALAFYGGFIAMTAFKG